MRSFTISATLALATLQLAAAQTFTDCNPTLKTCPADPALGKSITVDFTKGADKNFYAVTGTTLKYGPNGAEFTVNKETEAPTMESDWYIFFGKVEVVMQAAPGVGIVSSAVLQSDDLDEIDWEWLGGDTTQVQTNYFGKGDTTTYDRGAYHPVSAPQTAFHTYTIDWTSAYVKWSIDGTLVRTLNYADAKAGTRFPQTPMRVKLGNWVGGSSTAAPGTVQWAGGLSDFSKAPFTMNVKSITVTDGSTGASSYTYSDQTGSYQSIKIATGGNFLASSESSSVASSTSATSSTATAAAATTSVSTSANTTSTASSTLTTSTVKPSSSTNSTTSVASSSGSQAATTSLVAASTTPGAASTTASRTPSATPTQVTTSDASKFGATEYAVVAFGLAMGYLFM